MPLGRDQRPCWSASSQPHGRPGRSALPERDREQSAASSAESSAPGAASLSRQPPLPPHHPLIDLPHTSQVDARRALGIFAPCRPSAFSKKLARAKSTPSNLNFLPAGMLDLVPRPCSPPRVTIRGGFPLGKAARAQKRGPLRGPRGVVRLTCRGGRWSDRRQTDCCLSTDSRRRYRSCWACC
jgi:hypothetical protein